MAEKQIWTEVEAPERPLITANTFRIYFRFRWVLLLLVSFGILAGLVGAWLLPLHYTSEATVFLTHSAKAPDVLGSGPSSTLSYATAILKSQSLAESVSASLKSAQNARLVIAPTTLKSKIEILAERDGVIYIRYSANAPDVANLVVGEYLKAYQRYTDSSILTAEKGERVMVEKQLTICSQNLNTAERSLLDFEKSHTELGNTDSLRAAVNVVYTERVSAESSVAVAASKDAALKAQFDRAVEKLKTNNMSPSVVDDIPLATLQSQVVQARIELGNLKLANTEQDPEVIAQREKIANLESQIKLRIGELQAGFSHGVTRQLADSQLDLKVAESKMNAATQSLTHLAPKLRKQAEDNIKRLRLQREYEVQDKLYRDLETAKQQALLAEARDPTNLVVLDAPVLIETTLHRLKFVILGTVGASLGLFSGLILVLFLDFKSGKEP